MEKKRKIVLAAAAAAAVICVGALAALHSGSGSEEPETTAAETTAAETEAPTEAAEPEPEAPEVQLPAESPLFMEELNIYKPDMAYPEVILEDTEEEDIIDLPPMSVLQLLESTDLEQPYYMRWESEVFLARDVQVGGGSSDTAKTYTKEDTVSGSSYEALIFDYLVNDMKLNVAAACGILANMYAECSFRPNLLQSSYAHKLGYTSASYTASVDAGAYTDFTRDSAGYGLCQWTSSGRKAGLLKYARKKGTSIGDYKMQLEYMKHELSTGYKKVWKKITSVSNTAQGAYDAAWYYCYYFERPARRDTSSVKRGLQAANKYWRKYGNFVPGRDNISVEIPKESGGTVKSGGVSLVLDVSKVGLQAGEYYRLTAKLSTGVSVKGLTWSSDDTSVAKVSNMGNIKAISDGTCVITVRDSDGHKATCQVTVGDVLSKPTVSFSTEVNGKSIELTISWNEQKAAEGYRISVTGPGTEISDKTTDTAYTVTLKKTGAYKVQVTAYNDTEDASAGAKITIGPSGEDEEETESEESTEETSAEETESLKKETDAEDEDSTEEETEAEETKSSKKETEAEETKSSKKETTAEETKSSKKETEAEETKSSKKETTAEETKSSKKETTAEETRSSKKTSEKEDDAEDIGASNLPEQTTEE